MNQNDQETTQKVQITTEEIAAAFAVGLIIAAIIYVCWRAATSTNASAISSETAKAVVKSTMSATDIASMLNH